MKMLETSPLNATTSSTGQWNEKMTTTQLVQYEGSIFTEQCAVDTDRTCYLSSSRSARVEDAKRGNSRPPYTTDSKRTEFRFDWDRVTDVDSDDPWLQTFCLQNTNRNIGTNHPTRLPDVVLPAIRR